MKPRLKLPRRLVVPLFPLPNAILFPGARLPLYIFEPRYKQMVEDTLRAERLLSVALITEESGARQPAEVCGLGQITDLERLPQSEKNIVVTGMTRVRVVRVVSDKPYIRAEVQPLQQRNPRPETQEQLFRQLRESVRAWLFRMRTGNVRLLLDFGRVASAGEMCDFFGAYLIDDFEVRQELLGELHVARRARYIIDLVNRELDRYSAPFEN
jgi:ATP-dependent Lon protease